MESGKTPERDNEKRRNLAVVTSSLYLGGAQKVACLLANGLSDEFNVTLIYSFNSGRSNPIREEVGIWKLPDYDRNDSLWKKARCIRKQVKALHALKNELDIDAAISFGNHSNLINLMSKGKGRVICSERSNPKRSWGRWFFWVSRILYLQSDYVIFQSERIRKLYGSRIHKKSCVLKNPLSRPKPAYDRRERKIVNLGRLTAQKNHALLLRSFSRFRMQYPEYKLCIFGDGELEESLEQLIRSLGLSDSAFLEKNDPNVLERIKDAEMFVLSSDFEGLSNALLECMSMGVACISTKCEGSTDVIRNGENGLIVDIGDEKALAAAMCELASDPELRRRLERQAMEDMRAYDKDVVVQDWARAIRQCL